MRTEAAEAIVEGLRAAKVEVVATLPEGKLRDLVLEIGREPSFTSVSLSREEEGVGVVTGAYLAGKRAAMVCMSAGVLTLGNALVTLSLSHETPMPLIVGYSGGFSEQVWLHTIHGLYLEPMLRGLGVPYRELSNLDDTTEAIGEVVSWSYLARRPAALLLNRELLR
jgi:sulfopyruvate decarboxylase TPP-binding subunit